MSNPKATRHFDHYVIGFCSITLAIATTLIAVKAASGCPVPPETDEAQRAAFIACMTNPKCKLVEFKVEKKHGAVKKVIPPVQCPSPYLWHGVLVNPNVDWSKHPGCPTPKN